MSTLTMERGTTMSTTRTAYELITLKPGLPNRIHVVNEQREKLVLTMEQAIKVCHAYESQLKFQHQFETLLSFLAEWWFERADKVARAMVTVRDTGLLLVLVQKEVALDESLERDATELVANIVNDKRFGLIRLEAISLPSCEPDEVTSFVHPSVTVELALDAQ